MKPNNVPKLVINTLKYLFLFTNFHLGKSSAPALSSRGTKKTFTPSSNEISSRSSWNSLTNGELSQKINLDDSSSLGVAAPFLKSFMQVSCQILALVYYLIIQLLDISLPISFKCSIDSPVCSFMILASYNVV